MRQQFAGKGNPDGVVAHAQPFAGGAVFYLDSDGIDGYHEDKQHQYARCKGVAQIYGVVQPRVIEWMRIYDDMWVTFNVREDLLQGLGMNTEFEAFIPALDKNIRLKVYYMKDLGTYAAWKATKTTGQFDLKTFEVKAAPQEKVEGLRPGMSVVLKK